MNFKLQKKKEKEEVEREKEWTIAASTIDVRTYYTLCI